MISGLDYTGVAVVFYCHDGNKNFVFGKRSKNTRAYHGYWDGGGGKLEFDETIQEAVDRELLEEFGCKGEIQHVFPASERMYSKNGKKYHWVTLRHLIKVNRQEVKNNDPRSIDEIGWYTLDKLPEPLLPGLVADLEEGKQFLKDYLK